MYNLCVSLKNNNGDKMIQNYIIKRENDEEVLYLYLSYNYEFGSFNNGKKFLKQLKDFLNNKIIDFKGKKIVLIVGGITIGTIFINNINSKSYNIPNTSNDINYVSEVILNNFTDDERDLKININDNTIRIIDDETNNNNTNETYNDDILIKSNNNYVEEIKKQDIVYENNNVNDSNYEIEDNNSSQIIVTIYRNNGEILNIDMEEYLIGVVAAEMPASFNIEALKAQAILARTYTLKSIKNNKKLTDTVSTQVYIDNVQMKNKWSNEYSKYYNKIKEAVNSTNGMYITYNGDYIDAVYFSTSNGYTEDSKYVWGNDIPYLKSVESRWDVGTRNYTKTISKTYNEASQILKEEITKNIQIENIEKNNSNRIASITINGKKYTGVQIRTLFNLNSTDFDISIDDEGLIFTTRGYGHGVGMSQYGANGMANEGYNYIDIINHYYQGVIIEK